MTLLISIALSLVNIIGTLHSVYQLQNFSNHWVHYHRYCNLAVFLESSDHHLENCIVPRTDYGSQVDNRRTEVSECLLEKAINNLKAVDDFDSGEFRNIEC